MKLLFCLCLAVPLLLPAASRAQSSAPSIDVTSPTTAPPTLDRWVERTGNILSNRLRYPTILSGPEEGIVQVKFACSDSGAPAGIALLNSSGSRQLDKAAMRAVQRIPTLHPLPAGIGAGQNYVATILFATTQASYNRQIRDLRRQALDNNARFARRAGGPAMAIALLDTPDTPRAAN
ncbi:energy transducer TonB family protein [Sphingobium yanoikuyae]|uniref:energy transducer TonB family protein n=1 Tax=Sphingobium yanoikuyae TaxID=13690 RepID=UPI00289946E1|nr:energy transducer TonB [Sphingobium yanoikuyae]